MCDRHAYRTHTIFGQFLVNVEDSYEGVQTFFGVHICANVLLGLLKMEFNINLLFVTYEGKGQKL